MPDRYHQHTKITDFPCKRLAGTTESVKLLFACLIISGWWTNALLQVFGNVKHVHNDESPAEYERQPLFFQKELALEEVYGLRSQGQA